MAVGSPPPGLGPAEPPLRAVRRIEAAHSGLGAGRLDAGVWPGRGPGLGVGVCDQTAGGAEYHVQTAIRAARTNGLKWKIRETSFCSF